MVGRHSRKSGSGRETSRRSGSGWETHQEVLNWSGDPTGGLELLRRPSGRSGTGRETFIKVRKWSETFPEAR